MAKVSHQYAAMRRYPTDPQSPNGGLHTPVPSQKDDGKTASKKTWGQRLKIIKNDKSTNNDREYTALSFHNITTGSNNNNNNKNNNNNNSINNNCSSALSKSMKYTEPWLYGTVRGITAPRPDGMLGHMMPHEVAVVVCSCPEYLNGTKKEMKKASICKKCKGSRLPLAPIGGTMRIRSQQPMIHHQFRGSAGTVRLPSTTSMGGSKKRPTILNQNDPYDLMRRSRLVSPELQPVVSVKDILKNRTKSTSPGRSRSRTRRRSPSPTENQRSIGKSSRSRSASRNNVVGKKQPQQECWIDTSKTDTPGRRSILRYDVNPYDLIAKTNNEFAPLQDDETIYDSEIMEHSKKYENLLDPSENGGNVVSYTAIAGQRMRLFAETKAPITNATYDAFDFDYDTVTVEPSAPETSPGESGAVLLLPSMALPSPTLSRLSSVDSDATVVTIISNTQNINIKSILKRPSNDSYENMNVKVDMRQQPVETLLADNLENVNSTNSNNNNNNYVGDLSVNIFDSKFIVNRDIKDKRNSGSQFYLPTPAHAKTPGAVVTLSPLPAPPPTTVAGTPQRKKVQFLVENEVIKDEGNNDHNPFGGTNVNSIAPSSHTTVTATSTSTIEAVYEHKAATDTDANNGASSGSNNNTIHLADSNEDANPIVERHNNGAQERLSFASTKDETAVIPGNQHPGMDFFPRRGVLRRSFSERHKSTVGTMPKFLDTMALRIKQSRTDSRSIFDNETTVKARPKEPPPPPPPKRESSLPTTPERPPRTSSRRASAERTAKDLKVVNGHDDPESIYEDFEPSVISVRPIAKTTTSITANGQPGKQSTKMVVKIAPLIINRESSAVHRLKIRHDDDEDYDEVKQQKTSILINGDDCYSTVNVNDDTPLYQSSVVVNDGGDGSVEIRNTASNTVTISVNSPTRTPEEDKIYKNNKKNTLLSIGNPSPRGSVIPIGDPTNTLQMVQVKSPDAGKSLINLDFSHFPAGNVQTIPIVPSPAVETAPPVTNGDSAETKNTKEPPLNVDAILRDPVEAVRRNLIPHICGKDMADDASTKDSCSSVETVVIKRPKKEVHFEETSRNSFISKLLEDPTLGQLAEGLDDELIAKLIENSLIRLKESRNSIDMSGTKDDSDVKKMIDQSLQKVHEERVKLESKKLQPVSDDRQSNRSSVSSGNSYGSSYELLDFENAGDLSDCYHSCSSELTTDEDGNVTRSKFYQMLVDATLSEIEISNTVEDDHHYESIRLNGDPIYEEISEIPPPLPLSPPPLLDADPDLEKKINSRSIFEGASKYDILSYLVDAKERGLVPEETYSYNFSNANDIIVEEEGEKLGELHKRQSSDISCRFSQISNISDSSEDTTQASDKSNRRSSTEIERNDSGVGSETSKSSRSKWQSPQLGSILDKNSPIHLCEDCDGPVETQITDSGVMYAPLVCRKCGKKRAERKEILTEIVETEEKYGRDLQIILEEFYQPMLVAGLLSQEQLSAIFLNTEELLENNQTLAERMRDALDIATEQGDDDFLTVNIGRIFLDAAPMLHAFESYCVRQGAASLLLANLEKEKELLRIFLRVSQMENTVLRRMNLNSFLMVPVQRVTKYPLLLARLFKVTPANHESRDSMKQAQEKIELHLNHMNREAKDVPTKLWRRISSSSPNRRSSCEIDMINIKLRKMAVDVLEWNHDDVRFAMEGRLMFTQPNDNNWRRGRTIKLTPVNALLVTNGKPSVNYKADKMTNDIPNFSHHTGIREASLLLVREKSGRYTLLREPLYLDRCIICTESDWEDYFEVQEILSKDTFIFKAEDGAKTKQWYGQLQYHSQGMGAWRKRRNALANIMINGMMTRT